MNVASRDLCIQLKKLSNWGETDFCWNGDHLTPAYWPEDMRAKDLDSNPAYDTGYLLRQLPPKIGKNTERRWLTVAIKSDSVAEALYHDFKNVPQNFKQSGTPEDALCKLAIELFKKGILKRESDGK